MQWAHVGNRKDSIDCNSRVLPGMRDHSLVATGVHVLTLVFRRLPLALQLGAAMAAVALAMACGSSTSTEVIAPSGVPARCQTSLSGTSTTFGPTGGSGTLTVGVSRECPWSASSQQPWIEIMSAREGQGEGTVSFRVAANADPVLRRGSITVNDQRLDVSQDPAPCSFNVGATPDTVPAEGAQIPVQVSTHSACQWTAVSESSFATVSPSSGSGPATVQVVVSSNSGSPRTVTVVVAGARRSITQSAATPPPAPPPPTPPTPTPTPTPTRPRHRRRPRRRRRRRRRRQPQRRPQHHRSLRLLCRHPACRKCLRVSGRSHSSAARTRWM